MGGIGGPRNPLPASPQAHADPVLLPHLCLHGPCGLHVLFQHSAPTGVARQFKDSRILGNYDFLGLATISQGTS